MAAPASSRGLQQRRVGVRRSAALGAAQLPAGARSERAEAETGSLPPHPVWCGQAHPAEGDHVSVPLVVLLPYAEQVSAVLVAGPGDLEHVTVELVHSAVNWPATRALDTNTITWLHIPATHLAQLAGALSELATLALPGGTR
jgi:hypothetical protein